MRVRFQYEEKTYDLSFTRTFEGLSPIPTPMTTVTLKIAEPADSPKQWPIYRTATVAKWHRDPDIKALGRLHALRAITTTVPKGMRQVMWDAFQRRGR